MGEWVVEKIRSLLHWILRHGKGIGWTVIASVVGALLKWLLGMRESWHKGTAAMTYS
jgi:hypothetical protein